MKIYTKKDLNYLQTFHHPALGLPCLLDLFWNPKAHSMKGLGELPFLETHNSSRDHRKDLSESQGEEEVWN